MPPYAIDFRSSSDGDEAPESVSLARSKRKARQDDDKIHRSHAAQKQKLKSLNRERDKWLKERAANSKRKRREVETGIQDRAMRVSEGETEMNGAEVDNDNTEVGVPKSGTSEDDEEMMFGGDNVEDVNLSSGGPPDSLDALRLPDHLFAAASNIPSQKPPSKSKRQLSLQKKAKKQMQASKSLILG
jgi:hypothetical protein